MKLRIGFKEPINSGSPNYELCNLGLLDLNLLNLGLILKVDDEEQINTVDLSTYVFNSYPLITTNNSINIVNISFESPNILLLEIDFLNIVTDKTSVYIKLFKLGYLSFENTFEIYGYDIGNNPIVSITHNQDFNLILINELNNVILGQQTKAFSSFIYLIPPFKDTVFIYKNNSSKGLVNYYNQDNEVLLNHDNGMLCIHKELFIYQKEQLYENENDGCGCDTRELLSECSTDLIHIVNNKNYPIFYTNISCTNCVDLIITEESQNTAITYIEYDKLNLIYINDIQLYPYDNQSLTYNLFNSVGNLVATETFNWNINPPLFNFNPFNYLFQFNNLEFGDYLLETVLEIPSIYQEIKRYELSSCNWLSTKRIKCNTYEITNNSFSDITITISKMNNKSLFTFVKTVSILKLTTLNLDLGNDGVYQIVSEKNGKNFISIIPSFCNLETCIINHIKNNICNPCTTTKDKENLYNFNTVIISAYFIFSLIHSKNYLDSIFEVLDTSEITTLFQLQTLIDRTEQYCDNCINKQNSDCGCGK